MKLNSGTVLQGIGVVLILIGGFLAAAGTTSAGLFVFYGVLAISGVLIAIVGQKVSRRNNS